MAYMKLPVLLTYEKETGVSIRRDKVVCMYTSGEPHPRDRMLSIDLPSDPKKKSEQSIFIGIKTLERILEAKIVFKKRKR